MILQRQMKHMGWLPPKHGYLEEFCHFRSWAGYLLNMPELSSVLLYSAIIGELFTSSQILASFFNQSRSETVLANKGHFMNRTCNIKLLLSIYISSLIYNPVSYPRFSRIDVYWIISRF